jgi:serine/threonine protein kinase
VSISAGAGQIPGNDPLLPGARIGRYQLICRLAVGGMAELYLARAHGIEGFEKLVALKRILPQYAQNKDFIKMFIDEARLAASLNHQNIAQVYDIGQAGGAYFFTMEYVHGEDLRHICKGALATRGVPLPHALAVVNGVAAGLHYAHERKGPDGRLLGIVHRDVSPSNVLVTYDGQVKVVDFGIAKATAHGVQTRTGTLKGKIAYMAPEQCRGEPLDRRSDVFAIGILLYELTTGRRLFTGENEYAILHQIVSDDVPPPSTYKRDVPPELDRIVLRALARDKAERYPTAQDLQSDLEQFAVEHRLVLSSVMLSKYMKDLFGDKIDAWQDAQRRGRSLAEHIALAQTAITTTGEVGPDVVGFLSSAAPAADRREHDRDPEERRGFGPLHVLLGLLVAAAVAFGIYAFVSWREEDAKPHPATTLENVTGPPPGITPPVPAAAPTKAAAPPEPAPAATEPDPEPPRPVRKKKAEKKKTKAWDPDSPFSP